jgi:hypothetical protein
MGPKSGLAMDSETSPTCSLVTIAAVQFGRPSRLMGSRLLSLTLIAAPFPRSIAARAPVQANFTSVPFPLSGATAKLEFE